MRAKHFSPARLAVAIALILNAIASSAGHDALRPFDAKSLSALQAAHRGKPFVLAFWSIGCAPCVEELGDWGTWQRRHPQVSILLVSTDTNEDRAAVNTLLARHELANVATYIFSDSNVERVRWSVDRRWRGELPRTYFFDASHRREGISGKLDSEKVSAWMKAQMPQIQRE